MHLALNFALAHGLNHSVLLKSCLAPQLVVGIDALQMLANGRHRHILERGHHLLREPEVFIFVARFHTALRLASGGHKGQVLGR